MMSLKRIARANVIAQCAAILAMSAAQAQGTKLTALVGLTGTCKRLIVKGEDRTAVCRGALVNTEYADGRTGFYFVTTDGLSVTFSTNGKQEVKPNQNTAISPVDTLIAGYKGKMDRVNAVGTCNFANPYQGPALIECKAQTASGVFQASFLSDGRKPDAQTF